VSFRDAIVRVMRATRLNPRFYAQTVTYQPAGGEAVQVPTHVRHRREYDRQADGTSKVWDIIDVEFDFADVPNEPTHGARIVLADGDPAYLYAYKGHKRVCSWKASFRRQQIAAQGMRMTEIENSQQSITQRVEITGGLVSRLNEPVPKNSSAMAFAVAFAFAKLKAIQLKATGAPLTLLFTYADESTKSITLTPGQDFFWAQNMGTDNPFAKNVVSLDVTEGNVADANLSGIWMVDPT
jgi:hypothetical protein